MTTTSSSRAVLITGATGGLGQSLARRLVRDRSFDTVVLGVRDAGRGAALRHALQVETPDAQFSVLTFDVASQASVRTAVSQLERPVDAVVLNAGGTGGTRPLGLTRDGVTQIFAANVLGHVALIDTLMSAGLLRETVELVGSEAAFGVRSLRIPAPEIRDGSAEEFSSWIDGSYYQAHPFNGGLAYGQVKLLGALWIAALAREHPQLRTLTISPGNTAGTGINRDLPAPVRLLAPRVMRLLGRSHSLQAGTERLAQGLLDPAYDRGHFWASAPGRLVGPVVDQLNEHPLIGDHETQMNANTAIHRFTQLARGETTAA